MRETKNERERERKNKILKKREKERVGEKLETLNAKKNWLMTSHTH